MVGSCKEAQVTVWITFSATILADGWYIGLKNDLSKIMSFTWIVIKNYINFFIKERTFLWKLIWNIILFLEYFLEIQKFWASEYFFILIQLFLSPVRPVETVGTRHFPLKVLCQTRKLWKLKDFKKCLF